MRRSIKGAVVQNILYLFRGGGVTQTFLPYDLVVSQAKHEPKSTTSHKPNAAHLESSPNVNFMATEKPINRVLEII